MRLRGQPVGNRIFHDSVLVLLVAVLLFLGVTVLGIYAGGDGNAVRVLYVLPIALVAVRFGRWAGLAAALLALGLFAVWAAWHPSEIGLLAHLTRGVAFVLVGFGMGWYADQLRAALNAAYTSEDHYRALVDYAPEAVLVLDVEAGAIRQANYRAIALFGLPGKQLEHLEPSALSPSQQPNGRPSGEAFGEKITQAVQGYRPVFEWTYRTGEGQDQPCEVRLVRLPDPKRVLVRVSISS